MKTTLTIGEKSLNLVCNAFTPILFKQIFRRDFMVEFSKNSEKATELISRANELSKLQEDMKAGKVSKEEYLSKYSTLNIDADGLEAVDKKVELVSMLAFVMYKQSQETDIKKLYQLNELDYFEFLSLFEKEELRSSYVMNHVIAVWKGDSKALTEAKNA